MRDTSVMVSNFTYSMDTYRTPLGVYMQIQQKKPGPDVEPEYGVNFQSSEHILMLARWLESCAAIVAEQERMQRNRR